VAGIGKGGFAFCNGILISTPCLLSGIPDLIASVTGVFDGVLWVPSTDEFHSVATGGTANKKQGVEQPCKAKCECDCKYNGNQEHRVCAWTTFIDQRDDKNS
jgi:hypothetical protein